MPSVYCKCPECNQEFTLNVSDPDEWVKIHCPRANLYDLLPVPCQKHFKLKEAKSMDETGINLITDAISKITDAQERIPQDRDNEVWSKLSIGKSYLHEALRLIKQEGSAATHAYK